MALRQAVQIVAGVPLPNPLDASAGVCILTEYVVETGLALNDVIEMGAVPEGCVVTDALVATDDMDSNGAPLIGLDAGFLSGTYGQKDNARTCGSEIFAASNVGQAGGVARLAKKDAVMAAPDPIALKPYGLKVQAAAATLVVGAKVRMVLWAKPAPSPMV